MLDMTTGKIKPDDEEVFYDGFLYIICEIPKFRGTPNGDMELRESYVVEYCLNPEIDEPWTLARISEVYPTVHKVLWEDALRGYVYHYGNHTDSEQWERVGDTLGYA